MMDLWTVVICASRAYNYYNVVARNEGVHIY